MKSIISWVKFISRKINRECQLLVNPPFSDIRECLDDSFVLSSPVSLLEILIFQRPFTLDLLLLVIVGENIYALTGLLVGESTIPARSIC